MLIPSRAKDYPDPPTSTNGSPGISTRINDSPDAEAFVLWGLTFEVVSDLVVAAGGQNLDFEDPPNFRLVYQGVFRIGGGGGSRGVVEINCA